MCPGWSAQADADTGLRHGLGPGNTNVAEPGWVGGYVPGIAPTQYPPSRTQPLVHPTHRTRRRARTRRWEHALTRVLRPTKEILGVNNAHLYRSVPHAHLDAGPAVSLSPPVGPAVGWTGLAAYWDMARLIQRPGLYTVFIYNLALGLQQGSIFSISQYFSVYLSY